MLAGIGIDPTASMLSWAWAARRAVARMRAGREVDAIIGFNQSVVQDVFRLGGGTHAAFLRATAEHPEARGGHVLDRAALALERMRLDPRNTRLLVAPCARVRDELAQHYGIGSERVRVVTNGIDLARFSPSGPPDERRRVRERWGAGQGEAVALFVGNNGWLKGLDLAVRAAERAGVRLVYIGREPRGAVPEGVIWEGERSDVESAYRTADVLVLPARWDTFGGVVLEAYASGLPAVATDLIGATDLARGTALEPLLVRDPTDVGAIAAAIRRAIDSKAELQAVARSVAEGATLERWGAAMTAVLSELTGSLSPIRA